MKHILTLLTLIFLSYGLSAQPSQHQPGFQNKPQKGDRPAGWEQIESMKVAFFTSEMELTPEEAARFWPVYNQYSKEQRELGRNTHTLFMQIEKAVREGGSSDVELKKLVSSYEDARIKEAELIRLYTDEFYKVLSPEKTVRMLMAEEHFRFKMIDTWRSHRPGAPMGSGESAGQVHPDR